MEYVFSVIIFSISASITPGPNTIMAMSSGLNFGIRKSMPLLWGICLGFSLMLFFVGIGIGQVFALFPELTLYLKVLGVVYLLYLAYVIANSGELKKGAKFDQPLNFLKGVVFQWVNAKAWVVCVSAVSTFTTPGNSYIGQILLLTFAFLIVGPLSVGIWIFLGAFLKQHLTNRNYIKNFNMFMAFLLISSIIPAIKSLWLNH